ncbi:type VII secretion protein EssB/YukC [Bacillus sp. MUM 116]|uniref:type VII secretion protein EssB/YukC n=1 Tax=Bacillus sp. MUM 116 TaxID=1678002 RepID=UPI0015A583E8|nr:type VII secretion protein EssB/YukC [Bacillus sp. MUM 116]
MFLEGTLQIEGKDACYRIPSNLTKVDTVGELKPLKQPSHLFFNCMEIHFDKQYTTFHYEIEKGFLPLSRERKQAPLQKLAIAENLLTFESLADSNYVTFLHPENLYIKQLQEVKALYRGLRGLTNPIEQNDHYYVQCLIVYLFTKYPFHALKQKGLYSVYEETTDFLKHIIDARNFDDLQTAIIRERERLQESYMEELDKKKKGKKPQKKLLLIGGSVILAFGISGGSVALGQSLSNPAVQASQQSLADTQSKLKQSNELLEMYRLHYNGKYEQLINAMKNEKKLTGEEKTLLKESYLSTGQYAEAAKLSSEEDVVHYLLKNNPDGLKKWESNSSLVQFEKAYLNKKYDQVISLREKIKPDDRQKSIIAVAYMNTNKLNESFVLAKEIGNKDLMIQVKNKQIEVIKADKGKKDKQKKTEIKAIQKEIETINKGEQ